MSGNSTIMSVIRWKLCVMLLFLIAVSDFGRGQDFLNPHDCLNTGNYTANSRYNANLNASLAALSSNMTEYGFYNTSVGQGEDSAHAVALCRGDVRVDRCHGCILNAVVELVQLCPNQKQAIRWYEFCMLHYSNQPINGAWMDSLGHGLVNTANVNNPVQFRQDRTPLLDVVRGQAANGSSLLKVGAGSRNLLDSETLYVLMQCIPTLSSEECSDCLIQAGQGLSQAAQGARALRSACNLRYELYSFYNETRLRELNVMPLQIPNSPPGTTDNNPRTERDDNTRGKKDDNTTKVVIIIVVPVAVCLTLAACVVFFLIKRTKKRLQGIPETMDKKSSAESTEEISTVESLQYNFSRICAATNEFSDANKLGQGGFGAVYKGKLLDGQEIAVKRLSKDSGQGDKEFKNEVLLVARLQHRNLVKLLGFSLQGIERLLIYEFIPNGSLDQFIFDPIKSSLLDWERRYKIIGGIAKGLLYLHEDSRLRIIHRDLKPSNILLDKEMNPKIADFGLARLFEQNESHQNTSIVAGTYGYMSPEYALYGHFSTKSDVFSFGVLVLEIISGPQSIPRNDESMEDFLSSTWRNWCQGSAENIIDPMLREGRGSVHDMLRCIHIGLLCVQEDAADRPTMNAIIVMLSSFTVTLPVPSRPAFVTSSRLGSKILVPSEHDSTEYLDISEESKVKVYISEASPQNGISDSTEIHPR